MRCKNSNINDLVFTTRDGKQLSDDAMRKRVSRFLIKTIELGATHNLRHTAATDVHKRTKDMALLKSLLGHANANTTALYTHCTEDDKRKACEKMISTSYD